MKTTTLFSLFLLSTFLSDLASTTSIVLDFEGEPLVNSDTYYMVPAIWGKGVGGGIERVATGKETCPLTIVLSPSVVSKGQPIRVSPFVISTFILDGYPVRMGFASPPECAPSPWWTIVEGLPEGPAVKLSEYESTLDGWFKIEKVSSIMNTYKLVFCAQDGSDECGDIGIYRDEEGNGRLVVTKNNPLEVTFLKARSSSDA